MRKKVSVLVLLVFLIQILLPMSKAVKADVTIDAAPGIKFTYPDPKEFWAGGNTSGIQENLKKPEYAMEVAEHERQLNSIEDKNIRYWTAALEVYTNKLSQALYLAHECYRQLYFKIPSEVPVSLFIPKSGQDVDNYSDTKQIYLSTSEEPMEEMVYGCAHEMFHVVQGQYYNSLGSTVAKGIMLNLRWFVEATADYGALLSVRDSSNVMGSGITRKFIRKPLNHSPSNSDRHQYEAAWFIRYVVEKKGIPFTTLWEEVVENWNSGLGKESGMVDTLTPINSVLGIKKKTTLNQVYHEFASDLLFSKESPIYGQQKFKTWDAAPTSFRSPYSANDCDASAYLDWEKQKEHTAVLKAPGEGAGYLYGVINAFKTKEYSEQKTIKIELLSSIANETMASVTVVDVSGVPKAIGYFGNNKKTLLAKIGTSDGIYVLYTNVGKGEKSIKVRLTPSEAKFSVTPQVTNGKVNASYPFKLKAENLPQEMKNLKYTLTFDSWVKEISGTMDLKDGSGTANEKQSFPTARTYSGIARFYEPDGKKALLGESPLTVTITEEPKKVSPTPTPAPTTKKTKKKEYAWVLTETKNYNGPPYDPRTYEIKGSENSYTVNYVTTCRECGEERCSFNFGWNTPPSVIKPGEKVKMTFQGSVSGKMTHYNCTGKVSVYFDNGDMKPGFVSGANIGFGTVELGMKSEEKKSGSVTASVAPGSIERYGFGKMAIVCSIYTGETCGTAYIYEWKQIK